MRFLCLRSGAVCLEIWPTPHQNGRGSFVDGRFGWWGVDGTPHQRPHQTSHQFGCWVLGDGCWVLGDDGYQVVGDL